MKHLLKRLFIGAVCSGVALSLPAIAPPLHAKTARKVANPRTVSDYFLLLPTKYFEMPAAQLLKDAYV